MLQTKSSSKLTEVDQLMQLNPHQNKHNVDSYVNIDAEHGISLNSQYDDNDMKVVGGSSIIVKKNKQSYVEAKTNPAASLKIYSHDKLERSIDGATQKTDVECMNYMLPVDGKIEIKIIDNVNKDECSIILGSDGIMKIDASKQIDITAPIVNIKGQTLTQTFATMTQTAQTINIVGSQGDCKIKNVSLLNHKHYETQAGDVVRPQPTKTASSSN